MKANHDEVDVRELFIEELGEVTGGVAPAIWHGGERPPITTAALNHSEQGPTAPITTMALGRGEEGQVASTFDVASMQEAWSNASAWAKLVR